MNFQRLTWRKTLLDKLRTYLSVVPVYCFYLLNINAILVSYSNPNELTKALVGFALIFVVRKFFIDFNLYVKFLRF